MERVIHSKHAFEAGEGWQLCLWCGRRREVGPHFKSDIPLGFEPMHTAPQNATTILVVMEDGTQQEAHWAQDLSGEEQPPFRGWFVASRDRSGKVYGYSQISEPVGWKPIELKETVAA